MKKPKVLFICVHNSARSQMAAAFLNKICPHHFEAHSAGLNTIMINPLAVDAMKEVGIDISGNTTQKVFDVWRSGTAFSHVIKVCSEAELEARACPIFPSPVTLLSWPFDDPASFQGSQGARLEQTRIVRDAIEAKIHSWCESICPSQGAAAVRNQGE